MPQKELRTELRDKVAVVTGGTRGIGRAIAERLLYEGAHVALCGTRQKSVDDALAALAPQGRVFGMVADVSKVDDVRRFIAGAYAEFGALHILVNNAGAGTFENVAQLTPEAWDKMLTLNLSGVHYCCHEIMPIFKRARGGDVVNIGSLAGVNAFAGGAGYNASKFGLVGYSEALMLDHRHDGLRVSLIMPGSVDTDFGKMASGETERPRNEWKIAPDDIAEIVVTVLKMPGRTTVSRVDVRPSRPPRKT
jgi:NAD(P)-dependent dehydrogenase (short-subunit alcohol dehydrogenase family)